MGRSESTDQTAFCTSSIRLAEPAREARIQKATERITSSSLPSNSDVRIGQYTELGASLSTPSSRTSPTTPTISRQSSLGLTRICLPSALAGSCQYSRAILSETIATGNERRAECFEKARCNEPEPVERKLTL